MKICGIYKITSPSGKVYIGQSRNIIKRIEDYRRVYNCKGQLKLYRSLLKYGPKNHIFEIIEECEFNQLNIRERYWQDFYNVTGEKGLNCILTNTDEKPGIISEESKLKISKANKGKKRSEEAKLKMSNSAKGKVKTIDHIKKIEESKIKNGTNKLNSETIKKIINNLNYKKTRTNKHLITPEAKEKAVKTRREKNNYCTKGVDKLATMKFECIYCGIICDMGNYNRWHDKNCKKYENN